MTAARTETTPTDEQLAAIVARREESDPASRAARAAFEVLYGRHAPPLLAFLAARVRRADLDDLHQDAWRRAWQHLPAGFRGGNFRAWLFRIARNLVIDRGCKPHLEALIEGETLPDDRPEPPDARLIEHERREALRRCLERLDATA